MLLESEYLMLSETDPSKCLFVQTLQETKGRLKSSPDGRLFEALGNVLVTEWNHPVLLKMLQQEHSASEIGRTVSVSLPYNYLGFNAQASCCSKRTVGTNDQNCSEALADMIFKTIEVT